MITVPEGTKKIVERSRYLSEAISKGLINYSALARYIRPELEDILVKKVSEASIIMALKRLENDFRPRFQPQRVFKKTPEMNMRSSLTLFSVKTPNIAGLSLLISREMSSDSFYLRTQGIGEASFMISQDLAERFKATIKEKSHYIHETNVSALTIYLPEGAMDNSGIYYFFLKSLAWDGINILESVSTMHQFSLVLEDKDVQVAYSIISSLFKDN